MPDQRPLVEKVLDVVLYAPAGLAVQVRDDLPKLVADGRARLENRVKVAHWVGEMAVTMGRKEIEKRLHARHTSPTSDDTATVAAGEPDLSGSASASPRPARPPFDGYDELAAAQIVQLLPRLPRADLELIRAYESAGRARRTILNRVQHLLDT